jgi:molybdate transport system ATP-binding protein
LLADRLCLVHHGKSLQIGPTEHVLNNPISSQAARLIGHRNIFSGRIVEHRLEVGQTILSWAGRRIEAACRPAFARGQDIMWLIPVSQVVLHQRVRPSKGERENPISGEVTGCFTVGDLTRIALKVSDVPDPLTLSVPAHVAERNSIAIGEKIQVSLLAKSIHLMAE